MEKNLLSQTIRPLLRPIRVLLRLMTHPQTTTALFGKKWYYGTNLQTTGFLVWSVIRLLQKINAFSKRNIFFLSGDGRSVLILLFCSYAFLLQFSIFFFFFFFLQFCHHETSNQYYLGCKAAIRFLTKSCDIAKEFMVWQLQAVVFSFSEETKSEVHTTSIATDIILKM